MTKGTLQKGSIAVKDEYPPLEGDICPVVRYPPTAEQAMGEFLSPYSWDWWATLTWREEVGSFTAWNRTEEFLRRLEKGPPKRWAGAFIAMEKHRYRSDGYTLTYHAHLLIKGVADLRRDAAWAFAFERNGRARIEPFVKSRGATYYVSKYVGKEVVGTGEWDFWRPRVVGVVTCPLPWG